MMPCNSIERLRFSAREYDKLSTNVVIAHARAVASGTVESADALKVLVLKLKTKQLEMEDLLSEITRLIKSSFDWDRMIVSEE